MTGRFESTHVVEAGGGKARARLHIDVPLPPPAAPGAIITVANAAALAAGTFGAPDQLLHPVQVSVNFFREATPGTLTADAETIFRGRSTTIVDVKVRDEHANLIATLVITQLAARTGAARLDGAAARLAS